MDEVVGGITFETVGAPRSVEIAFERRAAFERALRKRQPVVHVPEHREPVAPATRRRERRATTRRSASSRGDPDEPHELEVIPLSRWKRELRRALGSA